MRRRAGYAPAGALREHLLHGKLRDEDEPFEVGGDKGSKLVGGVISERLESRTCRHW